MRDQGSRGPIEEKRLTSSSVRRIFERYVHLLTETVPRSPFRVFTMEVMWSANVLSWMALWTSADCCKGNSMSHLAQRTFGQPLAASEQP